MAIFSAQLRRIHPLPHRALLPRIVWGPEARRTVRESWDSATVKTRHFADLLRRHRGVREDIERAARAQKTRLRLTACHWAGWCKRGTADAKRWEVAKSRPLFQGPMWLGSNRPGKPAVYARRTS